jgi:hypothetical protein
MTNIDQSEARDLEGGQGLPYLVIVRTDQTIVDAYGPVNALNTKDAMSKTVAPLKRQLDGYAIDVYPLGITLDGQIERETYEGDDDGE